MSLSGAFKAALLLILCGFLWIAWTMRDSGRYQLQVALSLCARYSGCASVGWTGDRPYGPGVRQARVLRELRRIRTRYSAEDLAAAMALIEEGS
jgi:hypothetical protein